MGAYDVAVIGAGLIGLATAHQLAKSRPGIKLCIIDKERGPAMHQSGRNSGVLHSGIYYKPGSRKSLLCREGLALARAFLDEHAVAHEVCGKLIVACSDAESQRLRTLQDRGRQSGVACCLISGEELREIEPHCAGVEALRVPETGIADFRQMANRLAEQLEHAGARLLFSTELQRIHESDGMQILATDACEVSCRALVNCAGLQSDRVARLAGLRPKAQIVPFRGEYFTLAEQARSLCRHLIYPVPDPRYPFLGVHFTRRVGGEVECGPNAVLALAREGYGSAGAAISARYRPFALGDFAALMGYRGFWRMAARNWRAGLHESWRSISKATFVRTLQRLVPDVRAEHLQGAPAGIRAQALLPDGSFVDDFLFEETERSVHVLNAPSPGATACLSIGKVIAAKALERL